MKSRVDADADEEISTLKRRYEEKLDQEHRVTLKLKGENGLMKKRFDALRKDIAAQREEIKTLQVKEKNRYEQIKNLEKDIQGHKKEIREREDTINDKDKRIYDLRKKNQELEKFKFVLQYKIKELDRQIKPKESEIEDLRQQIKEMDAEMQQYHKSNAALDLMIGELRLKMAGLQEELDSQGEKLGGNRGLVKRFRTDLHETVQAIANYKKLKEGVVGLYRSYVQEAQDGAAPAAGKGAAAGAAGGGASADAQREYARQREYLEKSVESLKRKIAKVCPTGLLRAWVRTACGTLTPLTPLTPPSADPLGAGRGDAPHRPHAADARERYADQGDQQPAERDPAHAGQPHARGGRRGVAHVGGAAAQTPRPLPRRHVAVLPVVSPAHRPPHGAGSAEGGRNPASADRAPGGPSAQAGGAGTGLRLPRRLAGGARAVSEGLTRGPDWSPPRGADSRDPACLCVCLGLSCTEPLQGWAAVDG